MISRRRAYIYPGEYADIARWCGNDPARDEDPVRVWEQALARYVGVPHAAAVNSGRRGMALIFEHLGLQADDEVIIPAYTLKDLVPLIQALGVKPIPADLDPDTFNVTPASIQARLTDRTRAILVLHAFGSPCPIDAIGALAAARNIPVIEDCAHSLGARVQGKQTGAFGYAGFFSFEPTKPVNTFGGGMVVTSEASLAETIRRKTSGCPYDLYAFRKKVRATRTERALLGSGLAFPLLYFMANPWLKKHVSRLYRSAQHVPSSATRYTPPQARLGLAKLASLDERVAHRNQRAELLRSLLHPDVRIQRVEPGCSSTWYFFIAMLPRPAAPVRARLLLRGIDAAVEDEIADDCAALLGYFDCPHTHHAFSHAIALPMHDDISQAELESVARALNQSL
jgi:dTDP-4-amino-4,6-dideoxygalactose transaminase